GGIILHGICYDFFFVTGQIYVDNAAPKEVQASAQGFITLITYGLGMLIGSLASGYFVEQYTLADGSHLWKTIWLIPAAMALGAGVLFAIFFKEKDIKTLDV
ncbi:MAG: MFS family permease, partial [Saprospiraceae bacterium]